MRSRLAGLPSLDSSFQLVPVSTPSMRPALAYSISWLAMFSALPRFMVALTIWLQWADPGTANRRSSGSATAAARGTPAATAIATSSSNRSDNRFRNRIEKM